MKKIWDIKPVTGQTLDLVKLLAAFFMVLDHSNDILALSSPALWVLGRTAFPLFAFAFACSLARGMSYKNAFIRLAGFGLLTYPIYGLAFDKWCANILFTFACALVLDYALLKKSSLTVHVVFILGLIWAIPTGSIIEYGTAGIILPAILAKILRGEKEFTFYGLFCLIMLNANWGGPLLFSLIGIIATLTLPFFVLSQITDFSIRDRFLPKRFLYFFYPCHLALLLLVKTAIL